MKRLINIGFREVGEWQYDEKDGIRVVLNELASDKDVAYAFIIDEKVMYVGKTTSTLKVRMSQYRKPEKSQSTNIIIHDKIIEECAKKRKNVQILALPPNAFAMRIGGFEMNIAAGLEDSIISALSPEWNRRGKTKD